MSRTPFMPFFVDAYVGDTMHLTTEQHGAYLLLLFAMWRAGGVLTDDNFQLARVTRMTPKKWLKVRAVLSPLLDMRDQKISQKRLRKEWEYVAQKSTVNAINGIIGGKAKALKYNNAVLANATVSPQRKTGEKLAKPWRKPSEKVANGVAPIPIDIITTSKTAEGSAAAAPDGAASPPFDTQEAQEKGKEDFPELPANLNRLLNTPLMRRTS